jgi:uncharacterized protein YegL
MSHKETQSDGLDPELGNPTVERTPTVLILDTSYSMSKEKPDGSGNIKPRIEQLNEGLELFKNEIENKTHAEMRVDVSIVSFGGDVSVDQEFMPIKQLDLPNLSAGGNTPMGEAIEEAVSITNERKQQYRDNGYAYNRPLFWLLTDGEPTDMEPGDQQWEKAQRLLSQGTEEDHLLFFAFGIGEDADTDTLEKLVSVTDQSAFKLEDGMFEELFEVASNSLEKQSEPGGGEEELDVEGQVSIETVNE